MAIYNNDGEELFSAYTVNGANLDTAYDKDGNIIFASHLTVMTYNVQWFTKINSQQEMQQKIISDYDAHLIGVQELSQNGTIPSVGQTVFAPYQYQQLSNHKNYLGMMSKLPLSNIVIADYETQDPEDMSRYNETRAYMMADFAYGGKTITWINTHLCYLNATPKYAQMAELFAIAEQKEYCIITGDFNNYAESISDDDYVNMFKQYVDAGYNLANCSPLAGFTKTCSELTTATTTADLMNAADGIITSGNIDIESVIFDTTKFSYLDGNPIDHIPVIAELQIN